MTQKELKEVYREELKKVWKNDTKMVEFCIKTTGYFIEHSGFLCKSVIKTQIHME